MKNKYFTPKQLKAIDLLAKGDMTQVQISSETGVNPHTIGRWKKDPKFMHAVVMRARSILKEDLPTVYGSLSKESKKGSAQHIKILLDHLESLEQAHSNETTISFTWKQPEKKDE